MTIYQQMKFNALSSPNDVAVYSDGCNLTFSELLQKANSLASYLFVSGIKKGDTVAIVLPNIAETIIAFYAVNRLGAVAYMLNPQIPDAPLKDLIAATDTKCIFSLCALNLKIPTIVCDGTASGIGFNFREMKDCPSVTDESLPAVYLQSGGTTDTPKTVIINSAQFNYVANSYTVLIPDTERTDKALCILPMFHAFGLCIGMHGFMCAKVAVVLSTDYNPERTIKVIKKLRINYLVGIPRFFAALIMSPDFNTRLTFIKSAFVGGDHCPPQLIDQFNSHMAQCGSTAILKEGYGLSETASVVCVNRDDSYRIGSVGKPLPGTTVVVVRDGEIAPAGDIGELYIASPSLMDGYLNGENTIVEMFGKRMLATGDLGYFDTDGFLYFAGRLKQSIKTSGVTIFPQEIENIIRKSKLVSDVLVSGVPDAVKGSIIKASIIPAPSAKIEELDAELKKLFKENLPRWSTPKIVEYVDKFELTALGKKKLR